MKAHEGGYYIRLNAKDVPGALGRHRHAHGRARAFRSKVSSSGRICVLSDVGRDGVPTRTVVLITHQTMEADGARSACADRRGRLHRRASRN